MAAFTVTAESQHLAVGTGSYDDWCSGRLFSGSCLGLYHLGESNSELHNSGLHKTGSLHDANTKIADCCHVLSSDLPVLLESSLH